MSDTRGIELWTRLHGLGLVRGDAPPAPAGQSPWFVRVMVGIAGWIGAMFLLGFLGVALQEALREAGACFLFGVLCCGAAGAMLAFRPGDFLMQFAFALSLAGQALILGGFAQQHSIKAHDIAFAMAAVEVSLFFAIASASHRVWSAAVAAWAFSFGMLDTGTWPMVPAIVGSLCVFCWLQEFQHARLGRWCRTAGYGLTAGLLLWVITQSSFEMVIGAWWRHPEVPPAVEWAGGLASGGVLLWTVAALFWRERPDRFPTFLFGIVGAAVLMASVKAPGLGPALAILVLAYANGNRVLMGLGIAGLLAYLSQYYYWLPVTLLTKSIVLAGVGAGLLALRQTMSVWWPQQGAIAHEPAN